MSAHSLADSRLEKLLQRCSAGDRAAFQDLYISTSAQLFAVLVRILKRRDLSEEVLQEAFIKIWDAAGRYRKDRARPMTWMTTIARNQAIDLIRKTRRETGLDQVPEPLAPAADRPEQLAIRAEGTEALEECFGELSEQQRQSVRVTYLEGLTYVDCAQRLSTPVNTVKSWVRRGLMRLKECLER